MSEDSMQFRLRHVVEDRDRHGNVRLYYRVPNRPKVRLKEQPGTPAFMAEYQAAAANIPYVPVTAATPARPPVKLKAAAESFRWLAEQYFARGGATVAPRTMYVRRSILEEVCRAHGDKPYRSLNKRAVESMRDSRAARGPNAADGLVKAISAMFAWAIKNKLADANPCAGVERLGGGGEGFHAWSQAELERFEAHHPEGSTPRVAVAIFLFTGLRISDVAIFGRQHLQQVRNPETGANETWIRIRPQKTSRSSDVLVEIPVVDELAEVLKRAPPKSLTFLTTQYGKPFTVAGLGARMREWCNAAGLPQCSAHGLRKLGASLVAENDGTHEHLKAIFGWTSFAQPDLYIKSARKRKVAQATSRLLTVKRTVPPQKG